MASTYTPPPPTDMPADSASETQAAGGTEEGQHATAAALLVPLPPPLVSYSATQTFVSPQYAQPQFAQPQFVQPQYAQPQGLVYMQPGGLNQSNPGMVVYPQYNSYAEPGSYYTDAVSAQAPGAIRTKHEIPMGKVFGIPLRVHVLLPALTILSTLLAWMAYSFYTAFLVFWLNGPILWFTVLVHELGHCMAARKLGYTADSILLWPLGGLAYLSHSSNAKHDLIIAVSGPLTHGPQAAIWAILWAIGRSDPGAAWLFRAACTMQLHLFLFNLCPAYPLDGGRVVVDLMRIRGVEIDRAGRICAALSLLTGMTILIWGFVVSNLTMVLVSAWILSQANELQQKVCDKPILASCHRTPRWCSEPDTIPAQARSGRIADHPMFAHYYNPSSDPA